MSRTISWWRKKANDPPQPPSPYAENITSTTATIKWGVSPDARTHRVQMASDPAGPWTIIYEGAAYSVDVEDLTPGVTYYLRRRAISGSRESIFSLVSNFQAKQVGNPPPITPPNPPYILVAAPTAITVGIDAVADATSYRIQRSTTSATAGFSDRPSQPQTALTYSDTATASTTYWYRYSAINADGESGFSPPLQHTTGTPGSVPATPTVAPAPSLVDADSATLTMAAVTNATNYILERSTPGAGTGNAQLKLGTWPTGTLTGGDDLTEGSGLITSRSNPGVIWTWNDSNAAHLVFGFTETGGVITHRKSLVMVGNGFTIADHGEMEDGCYSAPDSSIWIANCGGNTNTFTAYKFPEPTTLGSAGTTLNVTTERYQFQWGTTGETYNCEAMMCAPNGRVYFIPKHNAVGDGQVAAETGLWQGPTLANLLPWGTANVLTKVATIGDASNTPAFIIGGADWAPDNSFFTVVKVATNVDVTTKPTLPMPKWNTTSPFARQTGTFDLAVASRTPVSAGRTQEGLAFRPDSSGLLVSSEGNGSELWETSFNTVTWDVRSSGTNRVWNDTGLTASTNYDYRYKVRNANGDSVGYSPTTRVLTSTLGTGNVIPISGLYFRNHSGSDSHPNLGTGVWQPNNAPEIVQSMADAGFTYTRGLYSEIETRMDVWVDELAKHNMKWMMTLIPEAGNNAQVISGTTIAQVRAKIATIRSRVTPVKTGGGGGNRHSDVCMGLEGANEPNESDAGPPANWAQQAVNYQNAVWAESHNDLSNGNPNPLRDKIILGPSLHDVVNDNSSGGHWQQLIDAGLDLTPGGANQNADMIGLHSYAAGGWPTKGLDEITQGQTGSRMYWIENKFGPTTQVFTSEWGYNNATGAGIYISPAAAGVYTPRGYLQYLTQCKGPGTGISGPGRARRNMYLAFYEHLDDPQYGMTNTEYNSQANLEYHTGLLFVGGDAPSTWTNKPNYTSLSFLLNSMRDPVGQADYNVVPVVCKVTNPDMAEAAFQWQITQTAAQAALGTAYLWIWRDLEVWNYGNNTAYTAPPARAATVEDRQGAAAARTFQVDANVQRILLR